MLRFPFPDLFGGRGICSIPSPSPKATSPCSGHPPGTPIFWVLCHWACLGLPLPRSWTALICVSQTPEPPAQLVVPGSPLHSGQVCQDPPQGTAYRAGPGWAAAPWRSRWPPPAPALTSLLSVLPGHQPPPSCQELELIGVLGAPGPRPLHTTAQPVRALGWLPVSEPRATLSCAHLAALPGSPGLRPSEGRSGTDVLSKETWSLVRRAARPMTRSVPEAEG